MDCRRMQRKFVAYLDGDLSPGARTAAEQHLASCLECREALESLRAFDAECRDALAYPETPYPFAALRARMAEIVPLDEVRAFLPHLKVQGAIPRFAVALMLMMITGGAAGAVRYCHAAYTVARQPFVSRTEQVEDDYQERLDAEYRDTMQRLARHNQPSSGHAGPAANA